MNNIGIKIKEVYLPFLVVSIGTILFYNFFRWVFDIQLGILPLKDDLLNIWIPMALPVIPVLIWLRRRNRVLNVRGKKDQGHTLYLMAMVAAIAVPNVFSQKFIEKASYDLVSLNTVQETKYHRDEKYFSINSFSVDKNASLSYALARTSGRNNDILKFFLYVACPFENSNNVWYGVEYSVNLSNNISDASKDSEYRLFTARSERAYDTIDFQNVRYFEKLGYSDERDGFMEAIKEGNPNARESEQIILVPKSEIFEDRLGDSFSWIFGTFGIGAFILLLMVVIPEIDKKELSDFKKQKPLKDDDLRAILKVLDPRGPNKVTAILLLLNIAVFLVMILSGLNLVSPSPKELLEIGGNRRLDVMNGEYWRLVSSMFIHGGIVHLVMNLFGLALGASLLEKVLGHAQLLLSFLVCGILASLASIYWHENTVSVGASGAIFGLFGLILAFTVFKIYPNHMRGLTWMLLGVYAGFSLLFGFFGGIDNAAHFGGLISGFLLGGILILIERDKLIKNASEPFIQ